MSPYIRNFITTSTTIAFIALTEVILCGVGLWVFDVLMTKPPTAKFQ